MSYEGSEQRICEKGHYTQGPDSYGHPDTCVMCGAELAWVNAIDDTNFDSWGEIPDELLKKHFLISEEVRETCNLGHSHITRPATYRIPAEGESEPLRHYRPDYGDTPLVPLPRKKLNKDK